jgi:DNA mismatch repair protein MutL
VKAYQELLRTETPAPLSSKPVASADEPPATYQPVSAGQPADSEKPPEQLGKAIAIVDDCYLLMLSDVGPVLLSIVRAEWYRLAGQMMTDKSALVPQPLLVPLSMKLDSQLMEAMHVNEALLQQFAIHLKSKGSDSLMVMAVPQPLRQQNLQQLIPDLLSYLAFNSESRQKTARDVTQWLAGELLKTKSSYTLSEGIQIVSELEQLWQQQLPLNDRFFVQTVDFSATIAKLNHE